MRNGGVPYFDSKFTLASLNLNWRLDALTLTSTTGYYDQTVQQMSVSDWSPYATIWAASKEDYELLTEELRANTDFDGPLNFMAGLYYEDFDRPFTNSADLFPRLQSGRAELRERQHGFEIERRLLLSIRADPLGHSSESRAGRRRAVQRGPEGHAHRELSQ